MFYLACPENRVAEDPQHLWHMEHHDMHVGSDMLALVALHQIPQLDKVTNPLFGLYR